jgi:Zn-dependent protease
MLNVLLALMIIGSFLLAIPLHEYAHAIMALWLGDRTPRAEGRQTLGLRAHIDSVGTLLCVVLAFQSMVGFGWGKPVKPDPWKLRGGANKGVLLVACAGPIFSLIIGILTMLIVRFTFPLLEPATPGLFSIPDRFEQLLFVFASVNFGIAILNILPIYPLDGYQILYTLLPGKQAVQFGRSATYGPFIILVLFFFVPFIANLANWGSFPLFQLAALIRTLSLYLMALVFGVPFDDNFVGFYLH